MANDRFNIRCTICGDYLLLGKYYPSSGAYMFPGKVDALETFISSHLTNCQPKTDGWVDFELPMCLVFDNEESLAAASGGVLGLSGNVETDRAEESSAGQ